MSRYALRLLVTAAALSLASCTGGDPTQSTTTTSQTTEPGTTSPDTSRPTDVPPVTEPVDLRQHSLDPCALLTAQQAAAVPFPPQLSDGGPTADGYGLCEWGRPTQAGPPEPDKVTLKVWLSDDPLAQVYLNSNLRDSNGKYSMPTFEPRSIRGLPALVFSEYDPARRCTVVVGTGNAQGIELYALNEIADPGLCQRLVTALEWMIDTVRG